MRSSLAAGALAACLACVVALDARADEKKHELVYRWDQLDGKTAIYDTDLAQDVLVERRTVTEMTDDPNSPDAADARTEILSTTRQRVAMTFHAAEGGRGRVTVETQRLRLSLAQKVKGVAEKVEYDSDNPPREGVPERLKAVVTSLVGKPYTLTVTRRGVVEKVEGRAESELPQLKKTFLLFPDAACVVSGSWNEVRRTPTPPLGDVVERFRFTLAQVNAKDERRIEQRVVTELDDTKSAVDRGTIVRIEHPTGSGHVTFDARGLRLEAATNQGYELYVKQFSQGLEHRTRSSETMTWKLVEVRDAK